MKPIRTALAFVAAFAALALSPASAETDLRVFQRDQAMSSNLNRNPQASLRSGKERAKAGQPVRKTIASVTTKKAKASPDARYAAKFAPESVPFKGYKPGTIVINSATRELFYVELVPGDALSRGGGQGGARLYRPRQGG